MKKPALFKVQTTLVKVLVSPLLVNIKINMDWTRLNVSNIEPKCIPYSLSILSAWIRTHQHSPLTRAKRDLMDTMLGSFGVGAGLMNSVNLKAIKNKLSSLSHLQDSLIQKQIHDNVDLVEIGLDNLKAKWNL